MVSLKTIYTIARFETKVLLRSWFFRIFSLLSLTILVLLNIGLFATNYSRWMYRGIPSCIPYVNLLLINVAQAAIGVFMASDFLKYDSKLDTTEVIYMRAMTNADYVIGKMLGVLVVFGGLNAIVLINALIFNVFFIDVPFIPKLYVIYPLLISLPTLMFIFGLTFLMMALIKNQAVTFILLLGYIATTLFFLSYKFHYIFDYMAFSVPLMYSDIAGFGEIETILIHRGIYLFLGIGFIFTTVLLLRRLPQSRIMNVISLVIAVCSITAAVMLGHSYLVRISEGKALRADIDALNRNISIQSRVSLDSCDLDLTHSGDSIEVEARLAFSNNTEDGIDTYIFSLNPGLDVTEITRNGESLPFSRNIHLITMKPPKPLRSGDDDSLLIHYRGSIDEEACYTDISDESREKMFRLFFYTIGKKYAFITPDYVLLTPENLWYPVTGIPYGAAYPALQAKDFSTYTLKVTTAEHLTAVSQGMCETEQAGVFNFRPEVPLPQLSLAIGRYEKRSVTVDDVEFSLFVIKGHDYFSEFFTDLGEGLNETLSSVKNDFENKIGLDYPYTRASLVETPIQFVAYPRKWTISMETVQPEQILLPEKGITLNFADFKISTFFMNRQMQRGRGGAMTPEDIQKNLFRRAVGSFYTGDSSQSRGIQAMRQMRRGSGMLRGLTFAGTSSYVGSHSVFPLYYSYAHNFSSDKWPVFTTATEYYLSQKAAGRPSRFARMVTGTSSEEWANNALMNQSFAEILTNAENEEDVYDVMRVKSLYLFAQIKSELGNEIFDEFLKDYLTSRTFTDSSAEDFLNELNDEFWLDLAPYFDSWFSEKRLPAFYITDLDSYEFLDTNTARYQVTFKVTNPEPVDGLISVSFRLGGGTRGGGGRGSGGFRMMPMGGGAEEEERFYNIKSGTTKEIGIILDSAPRALTINTLISQNLPSVFDRNFEKIERRDNVEPFDDERVLDTIVTLQEPGSIIIDNESPGFEIRSRSSEGFLKKMVTSTTAEEEEYTGIQFWNLPRRWKATTSGEYYGDFRHSVHFIRAGKGENSVAWNAELHQSGRYSVSYYVSKTRTPRMRRFRDRNRQNFVEDFHFTIHHDDGTEEVELDINSATEGWYDMGTYYFSQGPAIIELTDRSKGRMVYADAVKWTEQK